MDKLRNINHVTLTTKHIAKYKDDSVIEEDAKPLIRNMIIKAIIDGVVNILDGTKLECDIYPEKKYYVANLYIDDPFYMPLLVTSGAIDEQGGKELWDLMEDLHKKIFGIKIPAKYPGTPFIGDTITPLSICRMDVFSWSGDFTKCFGIEMLKILLEYKIVEGNAKRIMKNHSPLFD